MGENKKILISRKEENGVNISFKVKIRNSEYTMTTDIIARNIIIFNFEYYTKNDDGTLSIVIPKSRKNENGILIPYLSSKSNNDSTDNIDKLPKN